MRLGLVPEDLLERAALALGLVPIPLVDTLASLLLARTVVTAVRVGVFEALARSSLTAAEVASRCGTDPRATGKLLLALDGAGYVCARGGRYELTRLARRWLLEAHPDSLRDAVLHRCLDAALLEGAEGFVRTGEPVHFHETMTSEQWELYLRGQRAHAMYAAPEVARRTPVPPNARDMLDLGGGLGHYSIALCRRHRELRSTVFDLPQAVARAGAPPSDPDVAGRIAFRAGNALEADLGRGAYDLVFVGNLVHHLEETSGRELIRRVAAALRPGGSCVVLDFFRSAKRREAGQVGDLVDFFFAVTSAGGTRSFDQVAEWQRAAGLDPRRPVRLRTAPGYGLQAASVPLAGRGLDA